MTMERNQNYAGVFGGELGVGARPVVLSVDFIRAYTEPESPFYAPGVVDAVAQAGPFYERTRRAGIPLIYTRVIYDEPRPDAEVFLTKVPALRTLKSGETMAEFDPAVAPADGDTVIAKQHASAFYGTDLAERLECLEADTVIVTGCTTSGCIRATVVDVMQHGLKPIVAVEFVGDRHPEPHEANLFDMKSKYADVVPAPELLSSLFG